MNYQVLSRPTMEAELIREDRVDLFHFAEFVRSRWQFIAIACGVATVLAFSVSLLIPKNYTATASLLIEPPAGNDPRGATAISQIYLESLKTYERFASSDTVFATALDALHLRQRFVNTPVESLKRKVLRVTKPRDTKILEISVTLPAARDAQALAKKIAEETVGLSGSLDLRSQHDLTEQVRSQLDTATARLRKAERARDEFLATDPVETLESEIHNASEQKLRLQNELTEARIDLADYEARLTSRTGPDLDPRETSSMREQLVASKARTKRIELENNDLEQLIAKKGTLLERRRHQREVLENERQSARAQFELAANRQNDTLASAAFRSERLEIVDPGAVPEQPSSPNIPLNVAVAFLAALLGSLFYLGLKFSLLSVRPSKASSYSDAA